MMKRFSQIQKKSTILKRINEADSNLPENYEDMSKEELLALMAGKKDQPEKEEEKEEKEEEKVESKE